VKNIALADLNEDDLQYQTAMMELPHKDQTGRAVVLLDSSKMDWKELSLRGFVRRSFI
jgi:hypothetical protein